MEQEEMTWLRMIGAILTCTALYVVWALFLGWVFLSGL